MFDDTFAFHVAAYESPWGYIWNEGKLNGIARVDNHVTRAADGITPEAMEMRITDSEGRGYAIRGTVQAQMPFQAGANMMTFMSMARWECDGREGYGEHQDCNHNDHAASAWAAR